MRSTELNAFKKEAIETINRIETENSNLFELKWFPDTASMRFKSDYLNNVRPQVIVLGNDIPAEIIYAVCDNPFYILGGSLGTAHWADELTPRDTDPFSRRFDRDCRIFRQQAKADFHPAKSGQKSRRNGYPSHERNPQQHELLQRSADHTRRENR